ncbi:MAG: Uma2 family endonuclease [Gemmataceae bacterium]
MSIGGPTTTFIPPPGAPDLWRLSVRQYHDMIRSGILTDDDPVELLEGLLVTKMPRNPPHRVVTRLTRDALQAILPPGWHVESQEPITTDASEPEPDIAVIRGEPREYRDHHPGPAELALVAEVADSTLDRDRGTKKRIYARASIPVYWIVNLGDSCIEVYTDPTGPTENPDYRQRSDHGLSDHVDVVIDGQIVGQLRVAALLQ